MSPEIWASWSEGRSCYLSSIICSTLAARHATSLVSVTVFYHWKQHWTKYGHPSLCCHGYLGHSAAWWVTSRLLHRMDRKEDDLKGGKKRTKWFDAKKNNKAVEMESKCKQVGKEVEMLRDKQGEGEPQQSVGQQSHMAIHYQRCRWLQACYWDSQSKYWLQLEQALFRTLAQASPPLFPSAAIYSTWTNGLQFVKKKEKKRNKKIQRREKITGGLTVGKGHEGRLMTSMLEMKKQDTNSAIRSKKKKMLQGNQKLPPSERQHRLCSLAHPRLFLFVCNY